MQDKGEIYIVYGELGEYSDHMEWNVAAFTDEGEAEKFKSRLQEEYHRVRSLFSAERSETGMWPDEDDPKYKVDKDPDARIGSSYETSYNIQPIKLNPTIEKG